MVCLKSSMAAAPERTSPKPLHNFELPWLRWGCQRHLRCMNLRSDAAAAALTNIRSGGSSLAYAGPTARRADSDSESERKRRKLGFLASPGEIEIETDNEGGIAAVREKLLTDLKEAVAQIKDAILADDAADAATATAEEAMPRKARTSPPAKARPVRGLPPAAKKKAEEESMKLAVSLSREEIEADFRALLGHRPPRRPKKRARTVQRNLDSLFPGLLLQEITAERYKLPDTPES